jgi:23S rRNA pseudouridine2605 synthase
MRNTAGSQKPNRPKASRPKLRPSPKPKATKAESEDGPMRLHVFIAHSGLCSRRAAEKLIQEGRVVVNGNQVMEMGVKVAPEDEVQVDGSPVRVARNYTVVLNKPTGVVTTLSDPQRRPTIVRYLPDYGVTLKPVGRLDMDTEGLLICSNDGEFAHRLAHPSFEIDKEYQAIVEGIPSEKALNDLRKGVFIEGKRTAPAKIEVIHTEEKKNTTGLRITIHEGRKRQIRQMCELVGHPVKSLKRVRIGPLKIRGMRPGECRLLGMEELNELRALVGLPAQ